MSWACSDVPLKDMNLFKTIEKMARIVESYEPVETTDVVPLQTEEKL
jgi:hypothetical protein